LATISCVVLSTTIAASGIEEEVPGAKDNPSVGPLLENGVEIELPVHEGGSLGVWAWGDDVTIATGTVEGGISATYDMDGNMYAARCTTHNGAARRGLRVYKSTDSGATWELIKWFTSTSEFKYPQLFVYQSGSYQYLYVFYHHSYSEGRVRLYTCELDDPYSFVSWETVADASAGDSITYYSACTSIYGTYLTVVYEVHESGDVTPDVRSVRSTNQGSTWFDDGIVDYDGQHPDVAYGYSAYTYTVYATTGGGDYDIEFKRSTNYGDTWGGTARLINDSFDDDYPKVAALHTLPANSAYVWVTFNHDYANSGDLDVRYVYSTNSGANWSSYINLANSNTYDEMACDLWVKRDDASITVNICYLRYKLEPNPPAATEWSDICYGYASKTDPTDWHSPSRISDHAGALSEDGREVCQGTYTLSYAGIVYAGKPFPGNYEDLYFDISHTNQPPDAFALLFPPNKAFTPRVVRLDWETATDPDSLDEVRYDLCVSTSYHFHPDSTTIDGDLVLSDCVKTLDYGAYYWKVKARDSWGAETWSSEFSSFIVTGIPYSRGDFNGDGHVDAADVVLAINYLYRSGSAPDPLMVGDVNCDGEVNAGDVVCLINYLFRTGAPPCGP
jgi:hypothetical protein